MGTFLQEKRGEELQTLVSNPSPELLVNAAKTGIEAVLRADVEKTKAGQPVNYILDVTNTGQLSFDRSSVFKQFFYGGYPGSVGV